MGGAEVVLRASSIFETHQDVVHRRFTAALRPQLLRLDGRQEQFLRAGAVHLLADDVGYLVQHPPPERQEVIHPRRDLADEPRTQQQLVADHLHIRRYLAQCRREEL